MDIKTLPGNLLSFAGFCCVFYAIWATGVQLWDKNFYLWLGFFLAVMYAFIRYVRWMHDTDDEYARRVSKAYDRGHANALDGLPNVKFPD